LTINAINYVQVFLLLARQETEWARSILKLLRQRSKRINFLDTNTLLKSLKPKMKHSSPNT